MYKRQALPGHETETPEGPIQVLRVTAPALGRVDAIIFTAGVGEHASLIREWACQGLEAVGAILDPFKNATRHDEAIISKMSSRVRIMIIPTNEELMIARDTRDLVLA